MEIKTELLSLFADVANAKPEYRLGDLEFKVKPMSERRGREAYKDSVDFFLIGEPLITRMLTIIDNIESVGALQTINKTLNDPDDPEGNAKAALEIFRMLDITGSIKEISDLVPQLVAIICRATKPEFTAEDVVSNAGSWTNGQMYLAIFLQIKADNLFGWVGRLGERIGADATITKADQASEA